MQQILASAVFSVVQVCDIEYGVRFQNSQGVVVGSVTVYDTAFLRGRAGSRRQVKDTQFEPAFVQIVAKIGKPLYQCAVVVGETQGSQF